MEEINGQHWLNTTRLNEVLQDGFDEGTADPYSQHSCIVGPAGQLLGGFMEVVPTLVGSGPHPDLDKYLQRPRSEWPSQAQLEQIKQLPMFLY